MAGFKPKSRVSLLGLAAGAALEATAMADIVPTSLAVKSGAEGDPGFCERAFGATWFRLGELFRLLPLPSHARELAKNLLQKIDDVTHSPC